MNLKPLASMTKAEVRDAIRLHSKLFAYRHGDEEAAHAYAERHWRQHKETALDYLATALAMAEQGCVK